MLLSMGSNHDFYQFISSKQHGDAWFKIRNTWDLSIEIGKHNGTHISRHQAFNQTIIFNAIAAWEHAFSRGSERGLERGMNEVVNEVTRYS